MTGNILEASGIRVELEDRGRKPLFGQAPHVEVLKGVDFEIAPGECVGIVGESGSGKTTLGRTLLRLLRPSSGTIEFDGVDISGLSEDQLRPLRAKMQMIFQNPLSSFNPRRTVGESIAAPVIATGIAAAAEARDLACKALSRAGLALPLFHRYPHELSGGQRQRAGIARAIVTSPKFVLADEIVSGLDVSTQAQILTLLRNLQNDIGMALAFIAHDLSVVRVLCSRVMVMFAGEVVEKGSTVPLFNWPRHAYTRKLIDAIPLPVIDARWFDRQDLEVPEGVAPKTREFETMHEFGSSSMGELIRIKAKDGGRFESYLAMPAKGSGPGVVLIHDAHGLTIAMKETADRLAEEGYVVLAPNLLWRVESAIGIESGSLDETSALDFERRLDIGDAVADIGATLKALRKRDEHKGRVGIVGFGLGSRLAFLTAARKDVDCAVCYGGSGLSAHLEEARDIDCPIMVHLAGNDLSCPTQNQDEIRRSLRKHKQAEIHHYPGAAASFALVGSAGYDKSSAMMAYSRTLALLRRVMGPHFDLGHLWDMHCYHEFATRDVNATMATMVPEPYVNHIPTMTGGVGHDHLKRFYKYHFVDANPEDTKLIPISRTIGTDRVVDEMLFCFTHTREIDWMLPGIKPTGKYVEIPLVAIVCFRGDKLYNEHIYWSTLR